MTVRDKLAVLGMALLLAGSTGQAQEFPTKPIMILVPFSGGGSSDINTRIFAQQVSESIGQRVVIENKPGGGGVTAAMTVKTSQPDGHSLFLANIGSNAILQSLQNLSYDPNEDFDSVGSLFFFPNVLAIPTSLNVNSVADLVQLAKAKPGGLTYGSQGVGSGGHLLGSMLQSALGVPMAHVPYKGGGPLTVDLVAGRVDLSFGSYSSVREHVASGKLKVIAVASDKRWEKLPDIPTMEESGLKGLSLDTWYGLVTTKGTPRPTIDRLNAEFGKAARNPALKKKLEEMDGQATTGTPEEFANFLRSEARRIGEIIKANKLKVE